MYSNAIKKHTCVKGMILWNFGDLFICKDTNHYHLCNDLCKQLIIIDEYRAIYEVSE
jgi:hypothetical protein